MSAHKPAAVYRCFAADGTLLYIGVSKTPDTRMIWHRYRSPWSKDASRVDLEWHDSLVKARAAETAAIAAERPRFNIAHNREPKPVEIVGKALARDAELLAEIEAFMAETGLSAYRVGFLAVRNGRLVERLRAGCRVWPHKADEVREFLRQERVRRGLAA